MIYRDRDGNIIAVRRSPKGGFTINRSKGIMRGGSRIKSKKIRTRFPTAGEAERALDEYAGTRKDWTPYTQAACAERR